MDIDMTLGTYMGLWVAMAIYIFKKMRNMMTYSCLFSQRASTSMQHWHCDDVS